jgi:hypothetical protein
MRENRTYGSEGGEGQPFPTPIDDRRSRHRPRFAARAFGRVTASGGKPAEWIRGELACRGGALSIRSNLVFGRPVRVGDHDAVMRIGGKAPKGRPILQERHGGHGWARDTATSDPHRQPLAEARGAPNRGYRLGLRAIGNHGFLVRRARDG